jgi:hypothetical protein
MGVIPLRDIKADPLQPWKNPAAETHGVISAAYNGEVASEKGRCDAAAYSERASNVFRVCR